ncbi:MAG: S53 family peptidase [Candidatus Dormibacteraeota bacterium]|nr:S53 family peptidase [Candidatus Dormibacteraeota bacterium]MBO0762179.1 S53 family peptidase [Candidatus Dormibacteraeota bacterium]
MRARARVNLRTLLCALGGGALLVLTSTQGIQASGGWSAPPAPSDQRVCPQRSEPGQMACLEMRHAAAGGSATGYGPADLQQAYRLPAGAGSGATVAIVDAMDHPTVEQDLATYRQHFGLPPCTSANGCFRKVNQTGGASPLPAADPSWAAEIALDVDMVSAACPGCHILLVEAGSSGGTDLFTGLDAAVAAGARYVSLSWGGQEAADETALERHLQHPGVAIVAGTGDDGYGPVYPASSQYVTAAGGTTLQRASTTRGWSEQAWSEGGSGCSAYIAKPSWQSANTGCGKRATADVSAVADPETGVATYDSYQSAGWAVAGGTSVSAPLIAATYALAGTPAPGTVPASYAYANAGALNDVTQGRNGGCPTQVLCVSGAGWDGPTGLGTPNGTGAFAPAAV